MRIHRITSAPNSRPSFRLLALAVVLLVGVATNPSAASASNLPAQQGAHVCAAASTASATYTVAAGDSWFAIAQAAAVTTQSLLAANEATLSSGLHPGDVLCLPSGATTPARPATCQIERPIEDGDSWFSIANEAGVTVSTLVAQNNATQNTVLYVGDSICLPAGSEAVAAPPPSCAGSHTVVPGDSWYAIATTTGVSTGALLAANDASATRVLQPGDELCLPAGATPTSTAESCTSGVTVAAGQSWHVISRTTGVPLPALYAANDATSSTVLQPGDRICLPEAGFRRGAEPGPARRRTRARIVPLRELVGRATWWRAAPCGRRSPRRKRDFRRRGRRWDLDVAGSGSTRKSVGERVAVDHRQRDVLLLRPPRCLRARTRGRIEGRSGTGDRTGGLERQRDRTTSAFRDPSVRRRARQSV